MSNLVLTDDEVIAAMMDGDNGHSSVTYVIRNRLRPLKIVNTEQILAKLKAMEAAGKVIRSPKQTRSGMIEWDIASAIRNRSKLALNRGET